MRVVSTSVFNRLIDMRPENQTELLSKLGVCKKQFKRNVLCDFEKLLNTRSNLDVARYLEFELNVLNFGIPDLLHLAPSNADDQEILQHVIHKAIRSFEPRFSDLHLKTVVKSSAPNMLSLAIKCTLNYQPSSISVAFVLRKEGLSAKWLIND